MALSAELRELAENHELLYNIPRRKVEDVLIEFRDSGIGILGRNNGLVVKYVDGTTSNIIRLTIEDAMRIGLIALADHLEKEAT
jgi:hypothetical protein